MTIWDRLIWLALILGGFMLGSVMFSRILPRLIKGKDVTKLSDDGNPGAANVFSTCGIVLGMLCLLLDMGKGFAPVLLAQHLVDIHSMRFSAVLIAPVLGHALAPLNHFRGGKCIATAFADHLYSSCPCGTVYRVFYSAQDQSESYTEHCDLFALWHLLSCVDIFYPLVFDRSRMCGNIGNSSAAAYPQILCRSRIGKGGQSS